MCIYFFLNNVRGVIYNICYVQFKGLLCKYMKTSVFV